MKLFMLTTVLPLFAFPGIDIPPAGQAVTLKGVAIYRVENNKLMERWVVSDLHELLKNIQEQSRK